MSSKKRKLNKANDKRKKRDHPKVEQFLAVSQLANIIANLEKQEQQYIALLRQVADLTEHETTQPEKKWFIPEFDYSEDQAGDIQDYISRWIRNIVGHAKTIEEKRDQAMKKIRSVDMLDNDSLKLAAMELTETETQFAVIQQVQTRWSKIVRYEGATDLIQHTNKWARRWLMQWKKLDATRIQRVKQFRNALVQPFVRAKIPEINQVP